MSVNCCIKLLLSSPNTGSAKPNNASMELSPIIELKRKHVQGDIDVNLDAPQQRKMSISMTASSQAECRAFRRDKQYKSRLGTILVQAGPLAMALHSRDRLISATHQLKQVSTWT